MIVKSVKKIILAVILGIFATFMMSYGRCLPAGCSFTDSTCSVNPTCTNNCCTSETLMQHLDEKNAFQITLAGYELLFLFCAVVLVAIWRFGAGIEPIKFDPFRLKAAGYWQPPPFNYLAVLFSDGILKPKNH